MRCPTSLATLHRFTEAATMADSILSIDFSAAKTGLAYGEPGSRPVLSSQSFARWQNATLDEVAAAVIQWLPQAIATYQPSLIVVEAALPPIASRNAASAQVALGFDFLPRGAANIRGIRCIPVHLSTWRSFAFGTSRIKRAEAKARSIALCKGMGWEPKSHDEADAACIFLWAGATHYRKQFDACMPLFAAAQMRAA